MAKQGQQRLVSLSRELIGRDRDQHEAYAGLVIRLGARFTRAWQAYVTAAAVRLLSQLFPEQVGRMGGPACAARPQPVSARRARPYSGSVTPPPETFPDMDSSIDWDSLFVPSMHIGEIVLRGTLVYLFLFFLLRILRREAGHIGISDIVVVVLIADAAQNAMASEYRSITEGAILVATIAFWDYFLDWLSFRAPAVRRLLRPAPLMLIKNGRLQRRSLEQQKIQEEELIGQLREKGGRSVEEVEACYLESNGRISVIPKGSHGNGAGRETPAKPQAEAPVRRGRASERLEPDEATPRPICPWSRTKPPIRQQTLRVRPSVLPCGIEACPASSADPPCLRALSETSRCVLP